MGFLAEHCTIGFFTEEEFEACQPFTCGKDEDMDDFFRKDVFDYNHGLMSKAYSFRLDEDPSEIVCLFTLSNDSIRIYDLPSSPRNKMWSHTHHEKLLKRYPGVLIGRLAVNEKYAGKGIGSECIDIISQMFLDPMNRTGCRFIIVDAKNTPEVKRFYEKNGFTMLFKKELQEDLYTRPPKDEAEKVERTTNPRHLETRLMYKDLLEV